MATKKINFNEMQKQSNSDFSQAMKNLNNIETTVKPNKTVFEKISPKELKFDEEFQNLFPLDQERLKVLIERMENKGYDESQCIHIAKFLDEPETGEIIIDGHHRTLGAIQAEIDTVPVYRHIFDTRKEALIYALELQLIRRNEDKGNLYNDFLRLNKLKEVSGELSLDEDIEVKGKQSVKDAEKLGVSYRQVEKMKAIEESDREDLKEALKEGSISVTAAYDEIKGKSKNKKKETEDISESLSENEHIPSHNFDHSDHIERPDIPTTAETPENESDQLIQARRETYNLGFNDCLKIAENIFIFALAEMNKGRSAKEVYFDERISFDIKSFKEFILPSDDENLLLEIEK